MGFLTESKTLSVNKCLLSTHTREWHCYAMPLKGIYTLLVFENWLLQGEKLLPYIWAEYWFESNSSLDKFNTARFYAVDKSGQVFFEPDLETVTKEKINQLVCWERTSTVHKNNLILDCDKNKNSSTYVRNKQMKTSRDCQPCMTMMLLD